MNLNEVVPSCPFNATNGLQANLNDYHGKWVILYFYPKDATSGCTLEGQDFRDMYSDFIAHNAVVFGVSRDSLKSHENFKAKQQFPFELISDSEETLCNLFAVMKLKSIYGREYYGIERSTFLIDPHGVIKKVWRNVKVTGHVADVLETLHNVCDS
ncbi:MAG: peroxiredoxin [Legionellaceae bacterium]|nr:peroxiredoxin [Legionellaceae bacterium]